MQVDGKSRIPLDGKTDHLSASGGTGNELGPFEWLFKGRDEVNAIEVQEIRRSVRDDEMTGMRRVERPPKHSNTQWGSGRRGVGETGRCQQKLLRVKPSQLTAHVPPVFLVPNLVVRFDQFEQRKWRV